MAAEGPKGFGVDWTVVFSDSVRSLNSESRIAEQSDRIDKDRVKADTEKTPAMLLDELVALDREQRCEVAEGVFTGRLVTRAPYCAGVARLRLAAIVNLVTAVLDSPPVKCVSG